MNQTWPVSTPPDTLIDAMQSGDRLGYHPESAPQELAHFHDVLPRAQAAMAALVPGFGQRMEEVARSMARSPLRPANMDAQKKQRLDALERAEELVTEAEQ
jgi:alpha-glucosidase